MAGGVVKVGSAWVEAYPSWERELVGLDLRLKVGSVVICN
jgi:hypothetical protein